MNPLLTSYKAKIHLFVYVAGVGWERSVVGAGHRPRRKMQEVGMAQAKGCRSPALASVSPVLQTDHFRALSSSRFPGRRHPRLRSCSETPTMWGAELDEPHYFQLPATHAHPAPPWASTFHATSLGGAGYYPLSGIGWIHRRRSGALSSGALRPPHPI